MILSQPTSTTTGPMFPIFSVPDTTGFSPTAIQDFFDFDEMEKFADLTDGARWR